MKNCCRKLPIDDCAIKQICSWIRNHSRISVVTVPTIDDDFESAKPQRTKRAKTRIQLYSKLYYESKLRDLVDKRMDEETVEGETPKQRRARRLAATMEISTQCWEAESNEVKEEVESKYQFEKLARVEVRRKEEEDEEVDETVEGEYVCSPQEMQRYVRRSLVFLP
jgi:hypothetical protein